MSMVRATDGLDVSRAAAPVPSPRRSREEAPEERPELRVVPEPRPRRGVGVVVFLAGVALFASLFGLAVFHAMLVQSQSTLDDLDSEITAARARSEELRLDIAELESPDRILDEARDQGMVPASDVVVLDALGTSDTEDGSEATPGAAGEGDGTTDGGASSTEDAGG